MRNSMVITHTNTRCHVMPGDLYRTRTSDETCLLPVVPTASSPRIGATPTTLPGRCAGCEAGEQMIPAEKAAVVCQCSRRLIYRWIEEGSLHYRELPDGTVLVCGVTLASKLEQLEDPTGHLAR